MRTLHSPTSHTPAAEKHSVSKKIPARILLVMLG